MNTTPRAPAASARNRVRRIDVNESVRPLRDRNPAEDVEHDELTGDVAAYRSRRCSTVPGSPLRTP